MKWRKKVCERVNGGDVTNDDGGDAMNDDVMNDDAMNGDGVMNDGVIQYSPKYSYRTWKLSFRLIPRG